MLHSARSRLLSITLCCVATATCCGIARGAPLVVVEVVADVLLPLEQPSTLVFNPVRNAFVIVGDKGGELLEVDSSGRVLGQPRLSGGEALVAPEEAAQPDGDERKGKQDKKKKKPGSPLANVEAAEFDAASQRLLLLTEGTKKRPPRLLEVDPQTYAILSTRELTDLLGQDVEGLALLPGAAQRWIAVEKPSKLCQVSAEWKSERCFELGTRDLSGLSAAPESWRIPALLAVSHEERRLMLVCTEDGTVAASVVLDALEQLEGVAASADGRLLLVSDRDEKLEIIRVAAPDATLCAR